MRPSPIQVASNMGYGYTTGLSEIDYMIGDENLTPRGSEEVFSERLWRIPAPSCAYRAPVEGVPDVDTLPALTNGYVTFGSLARTLRFNESVFKVWKEILDRVPASRLRLDQRLFATEGPREFFWARLDI